MIAFQQFLQLRPCCGSGRPFWYTGPVTAPTSKSATVWFITRYVLRLRRRRLLAKATTVKVLIINIKQNSVVSTANRISSSSSGILWLKEHSCQPCASNIDCFQMEPSTTTTTKRLSLGIQRQQFLTHLDFEIWDVFQCMLSLLHILNFRVSVSTNVSRLQRLDRVRYSLVQKKKTKTKKRKPESIGRICEPNRVD